MNLAAQLQNRALQYPNQPAVTADGRTLSFSTLLARVQSLAGALQARFGVRRGDRVLMYLENRAAYIEVMFAAWTVGACVVPVNAKLHPKEVAHILGDAGACAVFTSAEFEDGIREHASARQVRLVSVDSSAYDECFDGPPVAPVGLEPTDLAWIFYTSGTTGFPKGAMLSHRNLLAVAGAYYADVERVEPGATMLHPAALSHGAGQYMLPHLLGGGHQVLYRKFDADQILQAFEDYPDVSMFAVPTMVTRLTQAAVAAGKGPARLRSIVYGGAPMYVSDLLAAMQAFGPRFYQLYGQGETPMTISGLNHTAHRQAFESGNASALGTSGPARTGIDMRVVDENGIDCPLGQPGEIIARSDCVMSGYWNNPKATAAALRDGWLWTGDIGTLDAAGYVTLRDRSKDMVISGGSNIYPREIEEIVLLHPGVVECSVVGRPHQDLGEEAVAFVVCQHGVTVSAEELDELCLQHIARFKRPRDYRFLEELPKSSYGKILKTELRKML
ncbi:long-chain fatty acid--CoA ligase [soil metagenome]